MFRSLYTAASGMMAQQMNLDNVANIMPPQRVQTLVRYAHQARREGIVSLDAGLQDIEDPFLKKALMLAVDGTEPSELRQIMELELDNQAEHEEEVPQVFESAGGFARQ
jgi:chemotaxis protein MotA